MLETCLVEHTEDLMGLDYIFQNDNAFIHVSKLTKQWFNGNKIQLLPWPSISPDMNLIENLSDLLVRKVYTHGRQFKNVRDLKDAILVAWNEIELDTLQNVVKSMPDKLVSIIETKGGNTKY